MTREEAIEIINHVYDSQLKDDFLVSIIKDEAAVKIDTALDMAIKALEQEPCEDVISREELLKAIDTWDKFGVDGTNSLFRLDNLSLSHYVPYIHYDDVVKCIKGMQSVKHDSKWTPVSEPPREDGEYLVTLKVLKDSNYIDKISYSHNLYSIDSFDFADKKRPGWYDYSSEWGYYEMNNVVAWMPLPETYKEESEDKE